MNQQILEKYKKIQEQFSLPHFKELSDTFKIDIEDNDEIFDQIRDEISERLFMFTEKIIEPILGGAETYSSIIENSMIDKKQKERLFGLYKKIQALKWENNFLMIKKDEKEIANWINKTWELWNKELETELSDMCKKMSENWKSLEFRKERVQYHG